MKTNFLTATKKMSFSIFLFLFFSSINFSHAQVTWVGGVDTDFYNQNNWSDPSINFADIQSVTLEIGSSNTNNPIQRGGNANDIKKRPGSLDLITGANFTVSGALLPWNSKSLNGTITLNGSANLNIRSKVYLGKKETGTLNLNGGAIYSKDEFYVGYDNGGNGIANILGGTLYAGTSLEVATNLYGTNPTGTLVIDGGTVDAWTGVNIGTNGNIHIAGIGSLVVTGDHRTSLNNYISNGKITSPENITLGVVFDGSRTIVSIPQDPNRMIREYSAYVILDNGILEAKIEKGSGSILSLKVNGVETISQSGHTKAYYDFTSSYGFETIFGASFSIKEETEDYIDISFKRPYAPGSNVTPCDADIHYVLKKNDTGLYTYSILNHKAEYPDFDLGSWRQVLWTAHDGTNYLEEKIYVNDVKNWEMPSVADNIAASGTGIQEIIKLTTGVRAGKYDGKYEYSEPLIELPAYGHASDVNAIGSWAVFGSHEFFNSGPTHHDLNAAAGIIHICMNGVHYNSRGFQVFKGEEWSKIYGPYLLYTSEQPTGDENWSDAKDRAAQDKAEWPFSWLTNTPEYPLEDGRGNIVGNFSITDSEIPEVNGNDAWIGVTQLSPDSGGDWQFEEENYQYWVKTDASGNFDIKHIRPGTYTLFAYKKGSIGEFRKENIVVGAGNTTNAGNLNWTIPRSNGNLVWEVGIPDRTTAEYKFGDFDYCEGFVQDKFAATFTNPIEYNIEDENWETALPYAHSSYFKSDGGMEAWEWKLNFTLIGNVPTSGNAKLTIAYASADHAQNWVYVNSSLATSIPFYPPVGGGNAFLRQSNHAKYGVTVIDIPYNKLHTGDNTISLKMPSTSYRGNHVMYDYISLEGNLTSTSTATAGVRDINANAKYLFSVYPNPTKDVINITPKNNYSGKLEIRIANVLGKTVIERELLQSHSGLYSINIKDQLAAGIYLMKIDAEDSSYFSKIIVE